MKYFYKENSLCCGDLDGDFLKNEGYKEITKAQYTKRLNALKEAQRQEEEKQRALFLAWLESIGVTEADFEQKMQDGFIYQDGEFIKEE